MRFTRVKLQGLRMWNLPNYLPPGTLWINLPWVLLDSKCHCAWNDARIELRIGQTLEHKKKEGLTLKDQIRLDT